MVEGASLTPAAVTDNEIFAAISHPGHPALCATIAVVPAVAVPQVFPALTFAFRLIVVYQNPRLLLFFVQPALAAVYPQMIVAQRYPVVPVVVHSDDADVQGPL